MSLIDKIKNVLKSIAQKGFFHLFSANIFVKIVAFGSQFFVAWWLTVEQIGEIKVVQSYFSLFTVICMFGFNTSILKLCSEDRSQGEIVGLYRKGEKYVLLFTMLFLPLLFLISFSDLLSANSNVQRYLAFCLIALLPAAFNECDGVYLQARKQIKTLSYRQIIVRTISLLTIILFTFLWGVNGYIIAYILSFYIAFITFRFIIFKFNRGIHVESVLNPFKEHWKYSKYAVLALVIGQLSSYADVYIMSFLESDSEKVGFYSFALMLLLVPNIFSNVIYQISVPYISAASSDANKIMLIFKKYQKLNVLSAIIIAFVCAIFIPIAINIVFENKYDGSILFFYILLFGWLINSFSQMVGYFLLGLGKIKLNVINSVITTIIKFIICIILINLYGLLGLSLGIVISNLITLFISYYFYHIGIKRVIAN